jgi:predicted RNA-binding Zn ribbon-like protein
MSNPAPGDLELVRSFVNTRDVDDDVEELGSPAALVDWLTAHGLLDRRGRATREDLEDALALREGLRGVLLHHGGGPAAPGAAAALEHAARRAQLSVRFGEDGEARHGPLAGGVAGALGRILAVVAAAQADGTWPRLKACPADDCQWAFYDKSRNRSAVWCSMEVCGNRAKVRSFRERHAH